MPINHTDTDYLILNHTDTDTDYIILNHTDTDYTDTDMVSIYTD